MVKIHYECIRLVEYGPTVKREYVTLLTQKSIQLDLINHLQQNALIGGRRY